MKVYTYSEARQRLASLLDEVRDGAEVRIQRRGGESFVVRLEEDRASPLSVEGVDIGITTSEIVELVREGRSRTGR